MPQRQGRQTLWLTNRPVISASAGVVGKKEGEGPLGREFDKVFDDAHLGKDSWEKAESAIHRSAVELALRKAQKSTDEVDLLLAGDLLNQCIGTTFGVMDFGIPFAGLYGACSTMALSLAMAAVLVDSGAVGCAVASTSSHFCSAEKQFRLPLEYGGQRPPQAQWTATAAGAAVLETGREGVAVESVTFGRITDYGVTDANNMGAAMAPAAAGTIADRLTQTGESPDDFDLILTGDLGVVGSKLLLELLKQEHAIDINGRHADCGTMLFDLDTQDVNSGGSGCGCSGAVVCTNIVRRLRQGELKRVLFVGTGALLSAVSARQGETIPCIAHGVVLKTQVK